MNKISGFFNSYRFLSNFYPSRIKYNGYWFDTVEHAYQANKAENPQDFHRIRQCKTPSETKKLGRNIEIREDWDEIKLDLMKDLVTRKFKIQQLRLMLLQTNKNELIEENTWGDTFWGVCNGEGQNNLGKILMQVRDDIINANNS